MEEIIKIEDRSIIDKITFNHPELMSDDAESIIREKYNNLIQLDNRIHLLRDELRTLEDQLKLANKEWNIIKNNFEYTHPIKNKTVVKDICTIAIKGHGNDIIGRTTVI